jgi:SAM-dependent methyltransferase
MNRKSFRVRAYLWMDRRLVRLFDAMQTMHQGLWLGVLDRDDLFHVGEQSYRTWRGLYRDREYNRAGLWPWEAAAVERFFGGCESILIGAAGGGRELIALARRGLKVDGFDCSREFVEIGRQLLAEESIEALLSESLPDRVPAELGVYDGLIFGWGAYMHICTRSARIRFLQEFRRHVRAGGPLLVSFLTRGSESRKAAQIFEIARRVRRTRGVTDGIELGDVLSGGFTHWFTRDEIESEFDESGFRLESYAEHPYGHAIGRSVTAA